MRSSLPLAAVLLVAGAPIDRVAAQPAANPPAEVQPQPTLRTPADQTAGTNAPAHAASASTLSPQRGRALLGTTLLGVDEKPAGAVDDLLEDADGQLRAVVIGWGGDAGMARRQAVVPVDNLQTGRATGAKPRLTLSREQLEALPPYGKDRLPEYQARWGWQGLRTVR